MPRNIIDKLAWWISNKEKREQFRYDINKTVIDSFVNNQEEFISKYPDLYDDINKTVIDSFVNNQEEFISKYPDLYDDINKTVIDSFVNNEEEFISKYPDLYDDINKTVIDSFVNNKEEFISKYPDLYDDINKIIIDSLINIDIEEIKLKYPKLYNKILDFDNDKNYLHPDCPISTKINHNNFTTYLRETFNKKGMRVLEIGSRVVTGYCFRNDFNNAEYIGFDYHSGKNVDIVGDAHKLSSYFNKNEKFDLIFSSAVFEHLAMPWKVAEEISKLLKIGGNVFVETHFSFSSHERPWHFFQFSDMALKTIFSPALGFECIEAGFSNPIIGRFSTLSSPHLSNKPITGLYCHSEYFGKKVRDVKDFDWNNMTVDKIIPNTEYPKPTNS